MIKRLGNRKRENRWQFAKRIRDYSRPYECSARYLRVLYEIGSWRIKTTKEIVVGFNVLHGITCVFMDGKRQINVDANGIPLEKIYQNYRVILIPFKRV